MKIFGRDPTLWLGLISSIVILLGTVGFHWLSGQQASLIVAAILAVTGAINAYAVRPIAPAAFTYAVGAVVAVAGSYGLNFTPEQIGAINAVVVMTLALVTRGQVSPQDSAVSHA